MPARTTTGASGWSWDVAELAPEVERRAGSTVTEEDLVQIANGTTRPVPDPDATVRMAGLLHELTGWDIFPELATDRGYVSRLWSGDWGSPEDAVYDDE